MLGTIALLFLGCGVCESANLQLQLYDNAVEDKLVCGDGSPGGYYFKWAPDDATQDEKNLWIIFQQGKAYGVLSMGRDSYRRLDHGGPPWLDVNMTYLLNVLLYLKMLLHKVDLNFKITGTSRTNISFPLVPIQEIRSTYDVTNYPAHRN